MIRNTSPMKIREGVILGSDKPVLFAGPCAVESFDICLEIGTNVKEWATAHGFSYVFKASFDKANRTSSGSFRSIGMDKSLEVLQRVGQALDVPLVTDIHESYQAAEVAEVVDVLQIPAFLCRQSDLLQSAGETGKIVNIKKGQFLSGEAMKFAVEKIQKAGNQQILLTERGNTFGYQDLVVDYRNIPIMQSHGTPVVMDCTHSLQQPNQSSGVTGGKPELITTIAKAAIAVGADGLFIETHPDPANAKSDGANMLNLALLEDLLVKLIRVRQAVI